MFRRILRSLWVRGILLAIASAVITFSGPIVIKKILSFLNNKKISTWEQTQMFHLNSIWISMLFARIFLNQSAERHFIYAALKCEQILILLVHEKIMSIGVSFRLNMKRGSLYAFFTNDIKSITSFLTTCSALFSSPATILSVQVVIFIEFK